MNFTKIHDAKYGWDLYIPKKFKDSYRDVSGGSSEPVVDTSLSEYKIWQLYQSKFSNDTTPYIQLIELIKSYASGGNNLALWSAFETLMGKHSGAADKIKDVDIIAKLDLKVADEIVDGRLIINVWHKDWLDYDSKMVDEVEIQLFDDYNKMVQEAIRVARKRVHIKLYPVFVNKDYMVPLCEIDALVRRYPSTLVRQPPKTLYDPILGLEPYYKLLRYDNTYDPQNMGIKKTTAEILISSWY